VLVGLAYLTKRNAAFLAPPMVLWLVVEDGSWVRRIRSAALVVVPAAIVVLPDLLWRRHWIPSTSDPANPVQILQRLTTWFSSQRLSSNINNPLHLLQYLGAVVPALVGLCLILCLVVLALIGPSIAPHNPLAPDPINRLKGPSWVHPFGTDSLGRDILSRVIYGSRISIIIGLIAVSISLVPGTILGLLAGFYGRRVDEPIMRLMDIMLAFPAILLAIFITAILGPNLLAGKNDADRISGSRRRPFEKDLVARDVTKDEACRRQSRGHRLHQQKRLVPAQRKR
jgi:hypothetical protein